MKRDEQYCACGECAARAKVATVAMRYCPFTDLELAQLRKARRVTGAKLAALQVCAGQGAGIPEPGPG